jgi:hypothetical protein
MELTTLGISCIFNPFWTFYIEKNTVNMFKSAAEIFTFVSFLKNRDELYFCFLFKFAINIVYTFQLIIYRFRLLL